MLRESGIARQTRRPILSLGANLMQTADGRCTLTDCTSQVAESGEIRTEMFLSSKTVETGIAVAMWITGTLGVSVISHAGSSDLRQGSPAMIRTDEVKKMQQVLQDRGHYRGKIDGIMGLHTRASIRGFQKAENLPVTGQMDLKTASKLGLEVQDSIDNRHPIGPQKNKPWGGTQSSRVVRPGRKELSKGVPGAANSESGREHTRDKSE
jgi:Putative peptidoglycan binding domain